MLRGLQWSSAHLNDRMAFGQMLHLKGLKQDGTKSLQQPTPTDCGTWQPQKRETEGTEWAGHIREKAAQKSKLYTFREFTIDKEVQLEVFLFFAYKS